jgi:hypothetical protein
LQYASDVIVVSFGRHVLVEPGHLGYSSHLVAGDCLLNSVGLFRDAEQRPDDKLGRHSPLISYLVQLRQTFSEFKFS